MSTAEKYAPQKAFEEKTRRVVLRLDPGEADAWQAIADQEGITRTELLRRWIAENQRR